MCRHLVYLGPPLPLAALLYDPPHSLLRQSYAPADMRGAGSINADGFGVGWYPPGSAAGAAVRYRRGGPLWTDVTLPELARATTAGVVLAAVRNATERMPVMETAAAPFTEGPWLFSHNGAVTGWPDSLVGLAHALPTRDLLTLDAPTDAALLWTLVRHRLRSGAGLADAVSATVCEVARAAPGSRLNLLLTDGSTAAATTFGHALWVRTGGATLVSSEPLDDDPAWRPVADCHLVVATARGADVTPLPAVETLPPPAPTAARTKETG
jgi:gamma-glutamyl hercynylcysteine S-oxide hydrolase